MPPTWWPARLWAWCWAGLPAGPGESAEFRRRTGGSATSLPECSGGEGTLEAAMSLTFAVTWDYRCPFARNAHEHVLTALEGGADWDVTFTPFSLNQAHVEEGGLDVWDDPAAAPALVAMQAGIAVRDRFPDQFLAVHAALFRARH